jgi:GTP cyclohydrolase I
MSTKDTLRNMPDVAQDDRPKLSTKINRVGMSGIDLPLSYSYQGKEYRVPALASAFVSLDDIHAKGIHMSRLFSRLQELSNKNLSFDLMESIVKSFWESHSTLSHESEFLLSFSLIRSQQSLLSGLSGWRHYPVEVLVKYDSKLDQCLWMLKFTVAYSSTCPCSAALSRQLIQEKFLSDFANQTNLGLKEISEWLSKEESICATPHSQRSYAHVHVTLKNKTNDLILALTEILEKTEEVLKTPVQTFVKRADEQEFARLNAENLMFCEDAARRIQALLSDQSNVQSYSVEVEHKESLHPHNAVAKVWSE